MAAHSALISAAAAVSRADWPRADRGFWGDNFAGLSGGDADKDEMVEAYLASLAPGPTRINAIQADAWNKLHAADGLVEAAYSAADAIQPAAADVAIIETAIGDLRECRDVFVASLKAASKHGDPVDGADIRALKAAFNDSISELGAAADELADRVASDRTKTYARPGSRRIPSSSL
ncbi:MAG: hypothetical protein WD076_07180 [Parvularculaceae bacterium]